MADDVAITAGTGTKIAADDVSSVFFQKIKLDAGGDGLTVPIVAGQQTAAASVPVVLASDNVPLVGASDKVVTVTPTMDTNAYASGELLFDSTEVAAAVRSNGSTAILESITIIDKADQKVAFTILIADTATDFGALNGAPDPDDTETATIIGWVPVATTDYIDMGSAAVACIRNLGLLLKAGAATTSVYIAGVNGTGTPTYAASDLVFQIGLLRS